MSHGFKQASRTSNPGVPVAVRPSNGATWASMPVSGVGAFGDVVTAGLTPTVQRDFVHGGHPDELQEYTALSGAITYEDSMAALSTGLTQYGYAFLRTDRTVRYRAGQGEILRFTVLFEDGAVAGVAQTAGAFGGSENGLFVGYNYLDTGGPGGVPRFGVCRQHDGARHVEYLEVTASAGGAETVSLTLNGTLYSIPVTAGTAAENAQEIAEFDFGGTWIAEAAGDFVYLLANNVGLRDGTYSITSTGTLTGTLTTERDGAAVTEDWVYQEDFNGDTIDGNGPSGMVFDPTKGNVFGISLQYLGFGGIEFYIENPETRQLILIHRYTYANQYTKPNVSSPIFALGAAVAALGAAEDVSVKLGSLGGFIEGPIEFLGPDHGADVEVTVPATSTVPVISVRCNEIYRGGVARVNLRDILPTLVSAGGSGGNKSVVVQLIKNGTLTDPLWTDYASDHSYASYDTSATAVTGGDTLGSFDFLGAGGGRDRNIAPLGIDLRPGDVLTIVMKTTGNAVDAVASIGWKEDG